MKDNGKISRAGSGACLFALCAGLLFLSARPTPSAAQLPGASAAELGVGEPTASVRGFGAVATNPAGLGMPREGRVTLALLPIRVGGALAPVTLSDLGEHDGRRIPSTVREAWLQKIEASGSQRGRLELGVTAVAATVGLFGFQLSTLAVVGADLNPDAAELLLFGNDGRAGEPREFRLSGSSIDAFVVTTAAVAVGLPLDVEIGDAPGQAFAVGATLKYTAGNAIYLGRDLGSFASGEPFEVWLRLPVVQTEPGPPRLGAGGGFGFDLGFQWDSGPWRFGLSAENVVSTFEWNLDGLVFRPGAALFTQDDDDTDFTPRPIAEAPEALIEAVRGFRFPRRYAGAFEHRASLRTSIFGQLRARVGGSAEASSSYEAGAGIEHRVFDRIPLRAHASVLEDGYRAGGGAGLALGNVRISGAASHVSRPVGDGWLAMLTVALGWD